VFFRKIKESVLKLKDDILDFIYPQHCCICGHPLEGEEKDACQNCWNELFILPAPFCPYCRYFLEDEGSIFKHRCPLLPHREERRILAVRSLGTFDDHYRKLIHQFKYQKKIPLGKRLAESLGRTVTQEREFLNCELVLPVPLHRARYRERGFNQSDILAEGVAEKTGLPLINDVLKRRKHTRDQTHLDAQQREANVKDAFVVVQPERVSQKKVILVDDVITTGATLNECARTLLEAGAKSILAVTLAVAVE